MKQPVAIVMDDLSRVGGAENLAVWMYLSCRDSLDLRFYYRLCHDSFWPPEFLSCSRVCSYALPHPVNTGLSKLGTRALLTSYGFYLRQLFHKEQIETVLSLSPFSLYLVSEARRGGGKFRHVWYCHEPSRSAYFEATDRYLCKALKKGCDIGPELRTYAEKRRERCFSSKNRKIRRRMRKALKEVDEILTNSHYTSESVRQAFCRESSPLYLGIPLPDKDARPSLGNSASYIGVLAPKRPEKNLYNIIIAYLSLKREKNSIPSLRIAGGGSEETKGFLLDVCRKEKNGGSIKIEGFLPEKERCRFIDEAMFIAYLPLDEPFGIVPFEALARRKAVVISNHGGMSEVLQHDKHCIQVDPLSIDEIKSAFSSYIEEPNRREEHAREGAFLTEQDFSLRALGKRLIQYFEKE